MSANFDEYLLADSNRDLIDLFLVLQELGPQFIEYAAQFFTPTSNSDVVFYDRRDEFNTTADKHRKSALFIYLNRHCFNGLCRYNSKGKFNVPFGRYANPSFPSAEMNSFYEKSRRAVFLCADFQETLERATIDSAVYCDPPYVPLTATANFSDYTPSGFGSADQSRLAHLAQHLRSKGIPVIVSNHDTPFTRNLYAEAQITTFNVQRFISSKAASRGLAAELIALYA